MIKYPIVCDDTREICNTYSQYLKSKHWLLIKAKYKNSKLNKQCSVCGVIKEQSKMHHHHKSYKRIGNERLTDIIMLCDECHSKTHNLLNNKASQKTNLWNAHKKYKRVLNRS